MPVKGYEGLYEVSNMGRVYSCGRTIEGVRRGTTCLITYKPKIMKQTLDKNCYYVVNLWKDGSKKKFRVHKLVAENFLEPVPGKPFVLHGRRGSRCNEVTNLRYGTHIENMHDKYLDKTIPNAIPDEIVRKIRQEYAGWGDGVRLSKKYALGESTVSKIIRGVRYGHLE